MKKVFAIFLAFAMALSLAGCGGSGGSDSGTSTGSGTGDAAAEGAGSITYVTLGDTGMEQLKEAAAAFQEQTGVEVKLESWSYTDAYQKIITLAEGGNMPDAMYGFSGWTPEFKEAGYIACAEDYISEELYNDFSETARTVCNVDGKMWALPSYMSVRTILFNQDMLDAAGVESIPTTWEEFLEIAPKLYDPSNAKYAYSLVAGHAKNTVDCFLPILWAYGADVVNEDGTANGFNNPEGVAALQMYVDLAQYSVPDYGEATINEMQSNWTNQVAAACFHNAQGMAAMRDARQNFDWAVVADPLAGPGGEKYSLGIMDIDLMFATGNEEITGQWLEFWHQAQYQGKVFEIAGWVPNQASYYEENPAFTDPENIMVAPFAEYEPIAKFKPTLICWEEVQKYLADAVTKAVMGELTAQEAMELAGGQVDEALAG